MVLESRVGGHLRCLIRSPTTLKRRPYDQSMLEPSSGLSYSLREIRYGAREKSWRPSEMPHQVTYDVVATPIRSINARAVKKMLLYYHGQL
eukprot:scaffold12063_cov103-Skeletonema_dohrnii-CCMP3373.AAC.1